MNIISGVKKFNFSTKTAVCFGKFDGVHLGHQKLLSALTAKKSQGLEAVVFTFDTSPALLTQPGQVRQLLTRDERNRIFEALGIDTVVEYPFNRETMQMSAQDFLENVVKEQLHPSYIAVGDDFRFGRARQGNAFFLAERSREFGCSTEIFSKLRFGGEEISSTLIRSRIAGGKMEDAAAMLGRPYFFTGTVVHGNAIGRTIGFPTLNILLPADKEIPPRGVYFSETQIDGRRLKGISNLGLRPTIKEDVRKSDLLLETHLLKYSEDAYGRSVEVSLLHYAREEKQFPGLNALKSQISRDTADCIEYFQKKSGKARESIA